MLGFLCKNTFRNNVDAVLYSSRFPHMIPNNIFLILSSSFCSTSASICSTNHQNELDFTISYLINSCGLSQEAAKTAAKKFPLKTKEKPDSVLNLLRNYRLNNAEIANIVTKFPDILTSNVEKTLKPKFEYFISVGALPEDIIQILKYCPDTLHRSLEKSIIPSFEILKSFLQTNRNVIQAIKRSPMLLMGSQNTVGPNLTFLKNYGVPESLILHFLKYHGSALRKNHTQFIEVVTEIKEMEFNPSKASFLTAIYVRNLMTKVSWDKKCELFTNRGWGQDMIVRAFRRYPNVMLLSEEKFEKVMDFIAKIGLNSSDFATFPDLLCYSLEKRIIPRCLVIQILHLNGLITRSYKFSTVLRGSESRFIDMFVTKHLEQVPDLLNLYRDNAKHLGSDIQLKGVFCV